LLHSRRFQATAIVQMLMFFYLSCVYIRLYKHFTITCNTRHQKTPYNLSSTSTHKVCIKKCVEFLSSFPQRLFTHLIFVLFWMISISILLKNTTSLLSTYEILDSRYTHIFIHSLTHTFTSSLSQTNIYNQPNSHTKTHCISN